MLFMGPPTQNSIQLCDICQCANLTEGPFSKCSKSSATKVRSPCMIHSLMTTLPKDTMTFRGKNNQMKYSITTTLATPWSVWPLTG